MNDLRRILLASLTVFLLMGLDVSLSMAQNKNFIPVEGATLKTRIENAVTIGRTNAPGGRFWVGYQFEVRPGIAIDFEIVDSSGSVYISNDGWSTMSDSRYETRELGLFFFFETQRDSFTRAEVYNLRRGHEFSSYPVYWTGRASNEESLNYLKSIVDSTAPEVNRLADRATFAIALHDDARVEPLLMEIIRKPINESIRSRAIFWLGNSPESTEKNNFLADIVRNQQESTDARQQAMSALGMSRSTAALSLLESLYEAMPSKDLKRRALAGIARNDNHDGAATFLIRIAENETDLDLRKSAISGLGRVAGEKSMSALNTALESDPETEVQKQAVIAIGRRPKDEAIPILIRTARTHPKMAVRQQAIRTLAQTGDERAIALFKELLAK